jgi:hypothetical protein
MKKGLGLFVALCAADSGRFLKNLIEVAAVLLYD